MLSVSEIKMILKHWAVEEWINFTVAEFNERFCDSEFHLLSDDKFNILCVTRINFDFKIELDNTVYELPELVGLVAMEKMKGYARQLIGHIVHNLSSRAIACIGFCEAELRPFYEKCSVPILYDQAKYLKEKPVSEEFEPNTDDDILDINLPAHLRDLLAGLNAGHTGYILFED
ncbi:hypothetical protein [Pedobacter lusitanus]|nr:hypothetical protein [Pedobacter lusitanus]